MKIPKEYSHEYVTCLPKELENDIMENIEATIATLWLSENEKKEAVKNASNSKVCDLTDTIDIEFV